jgi:ribosomal protein S18 acetylase RimI-like enzyme
MQWPGRIDPDDLEGGGAQQTPPGQDALVESWSRLAATSPGAFVAHLDVGVAAVFPGWSALNNAIVDRGADHGVAADLLRTFYSSAGISNWALWIASDALGFATDDVVDRVVGFRRDTTTLIMQAPLDKGRAVDPRIVRTSVATATRAADEPVPMCELDEGGVVAEPLEAWVLVDRDLAVSGAWSLIHHSDCGIYSVGTAPAWRRRGYASALVDAVLDAAFRRHATTASLQSTAEAQPLYAALGFRPVGRYEEWVPVDA